MRDRFILEVTMALVPGNSLLTDTPEEGRELAIMISRKTIGAIQPDGDTRHTLRPGYATDADSLTMAAHVVAVEFATVAAANNYEGEQPTAKDTYSPSIHLV